MLHHRPGALHGRESAGRITPDACRNMLPEQLLNRLFVSYARGLYDRYTLLPERGTGMIRKFIACCLALALVLCCACSFAEEDAWVCPECGNGNTTNFCTKCGTKKPDMIACPGCGTQYPADTDAVFCGECGTKLLPDARAAGRYEGEGFDTPEEAVTCYLNGLKNLDFEQMLGAYAWETQAAHYSVELYLERLKSYSPTYSVRIPPINDFLISANLHALRAQETRLIYNSLETFLLGEDAPQGMVIPLNEDGAVAEFLEKFDNGRLEKLSGLANIAFHSPDEVTEGRFSMERNQENFMKQTAVYGADEVVNLVATADLADGTLVCMPTVARYGGRWYMVSVSSMVSMMLGIDMNNQAFMFAEGDLPDFMH